MKRCIHTFIYVYVDVYMYTFIGVYIIVCAKTLNIVRLSTIYINS